MVSATVEVAVAVPVAVTLTLEAFNAPPMPETPDAASCAAVRMPSAIMEAVLPKMPDSALEPVKATARLILPLMTEKSALTGDCVVSASDEAV